MRTPYGPGVSIPTDNGAEIEALAGSNPSFAAWEQNEPYTIALLIKGRSGGTGTKHLYRSGSSSTGDHILFMTSGTTPNLRHEASGGGSVSITSSVAIVNDTTWSTIVGTWRPGPGSALHLLSVPARLASGQGGAQDLGETVHGTVAFGNR